MHQNFVVVIADRFATFQFIQLDQEGTPCNDPTVFSIISMVALTVPPSQKVINDEDALAWFDGICVHAEGIHTVFFRSQQK